MESNRNIKKNILLKGILYPFNSSKRKYFERKRETYNYLYSNIIGGHVKVHLRNIPGEFEIDARSDILKRILLYKEYEPQITNHILDNIDPTMDVVNIGANIGLFTNLVAEMINVDRKVLAVEPTPNAFALLQANIENNNNSQKTILFNGIATDKPGEYELDLIIGKEEYSSVGKVSHPHVKMEKSTTITTKGETVDNLVEKHRLRPSLMIIDVEGAEHSVFSGAEKTLKDFSPVIISELDDNLLQAHKSNSKMIVNYLESLGYIVVDPFMKAVGFPFTGNIIAKKPGSVSKMK